MKTTRRADEEETMERTMAVEQEARVVRAVAESGEYAFVEVRPGRFAVTAKSGKAYLVTALSCTCPDYLHRCSGTELRCKHQVALAHKLLAEGRLPDAPKKKAPPVRTPEGVTEAMIDRIFG